MRAAEVLLWLGGISAALLSVLALATWAVKAATRVAAPFFATAVETALAERLNNIDSELRPNGGSSLKDTVNKTVQTVDGVAIQLHKLAEEHQKQWEYQHDRNHDIIAKQSVMTMFIKALHLRDLEEMGFPPEALDTITVIEDRRQEPRD